MPSMDYTRLRGLLRAKGFTQKGLAAALKITECTLCLKLPGKYSFTSREIQGIAALLGIASEEIGAYFFTPEV